MALQLFIAGQWVGDLRADVSNIKERLQRIETTIDQWRR